ncbi:MAG: hypothetical protein LUD72_11870 [Bacteroidales bacterium]|nr:hypothetical protein [Bacteroidales bacterium]
MKSKRKFLSIFAILFALVFALSVCFFAACGKKDDDEKDDDTTTEQEENTGSTGGDEGGDTGTTDGTEGGDTSGDTGSDTGTAHAHDYVVDAGATWTWNEDNTACTAPATCTNLDGLCAELEGTVSAVVTTASSGASCTEPGYTWQVASYGTGEVSTTEKVSTGEAALGHEVTATYNDETSAWTYICVRGDEVDIENDEIISLVYEAGTEAALTSAATMGGAIKLTAESGIVLTSELEISADVTLDLAGCEISSADSLSSATHTISVAKEAALTVTDSGTEGTIKNTYVTASSTSGTSLDNAAAVYVEGCLVIDGGEIVSTSIGVKAEDGGRVTVNGGSITSGYFAMWLGGNGTAITVNDGTISGTDKGIVLCGDGNYGHADADGNNVWQTNAVQTLTVNGGTFSCEKDSVICTLGTTNRSSSIVNINGGTFTSTEVVDGDTGTAMPTVYIPNGTVTITDGTFNGSTPLEIRGGTVVISDGTFNCTATATSSATYNGSGATSYGYALSVFPYPSTVQVNGQNADNVPNVTVKGGTFDRGIYIATSEDFTSAGRTYPDGTSFTISGGTFGSDPSAYLDTTGGCVVDSTSISGKYIVCKNTESFIVPVAGSEEAALTTTYSAGSTIENNTLFKITASVKMNYSVGSAYGNIQNSGGSNALSFTDINGTSVSPDQGICMSSNFEANEKKDSIVEITAKADVKLYVYVVFTNQSYNSNKTGKVFCTINNGEKQGEQEFTKRNSCWTFGTAGIELKAGDVLVIGGEDSNGDKANFWLFGAEAVLASSLQA